VTVAGQVVKLAIQFTSVVVLSRLLSPDDFGLIAMASVFVAFASLLRDFGMPTAALQARSLSNQQASNILWVNVLLGVCGGLLLLATSPLIVALFDEPRLYAILPIMAAALVLGGFSAQYQVHFARAARFGRLVVVDVLAQLLGLAAAVVLAISGAGYWALVCQIAVTAIVLLSAQIAGSRWIPLRPRRGAGTSDLVRAGMHFGGAQMLTFVASNADTVVIGARWTATDLGYYNRAYQLLALPVQAMLAPLTQVVVPMANRVRAAGGSVEHLLLRVQFLVGLVGVSVFMVAWVIAPDLVPIILGDGWDDTSQLFRILSVGGAVQIFSYVSYWSFVLGEQSRALLHYNLLTKTLTVVAIVLGGMVSVEAVAWAVSLSLVVSWPINLLWLRGATGQDSRRFFLSGLRILVGGLAGALTGWFVLEVAIDLDSVVRVGLAATCSLCVLAALVVCTPGGFAEVRAAWKAARLAIARV
jgi:PST family polysaccharide transporter